MQIYLREDRAKFRGSDEKGCFCRRVFCLCRETWLALRKDHRPDSSHHHVRLAGDTCPQKGPELGFRVLSALPARSANRDILGLDDGPSCPFWSHADANSLPVCLVFNRLGRAHLPAGQGVRDLLGRAWSGYSCPLGCRHRLHALLPSRLRWYGVHGHGFTASTNLHSHATGCFHHLAVSPQCKLVCSSCARGRAAERGPSGDCLPTDRSLVSLLGSLSHDCPAD